ncbi:MAG: hypothetical protein RI884_1081 [Pseudomonadota bacterium]|jgi:hypothetical protein
MASPTQVDLVLVIDTSTSMRPCIDQLKTHLKELIKPLQGHIGRVRFGLVGLSASSKDGEIVYMPRTLAGDTESLGWLYSDANQYEFLTDDTDKVIERLDSLTVTGDEDNLVALDIALDHPFGPVSTTKRVVALFSDEKLEAGAQRGAIKDYIPRLVEKLHARRIKLFCAMPYSTVAQQLSEANGSEIEDVGGQGLTTVDFKALLGQMGKSISIASLQGALEEKYERALFGQDQWVRTDAQWGDSDNS